MRRLLKRLGKTPIFQRSPLWMEQEQERRQRRRKAAQIQRAAKGKKGKQNDDRSND